MKIKGVIRCTSNDAATVLELSVRRWFRTRTEVWTRAEKGKCVHQPVFMAYTDMWQHKPWFRSDGKKPSCRFSLRLDRIAFAFDHRPDLLGMPDNVVELNRRGMYR